MLPTTSCLLGNLLFAVSAIAAGHRPLSSYTIVDLQWDLPITPGDATADTIKVNGTIQNAIEQMELLYPGWNHTFQNHLQHLPDTTINKPAIREEPEDIDCNIKTMSARNWAIKKGIEYLRGVSGTPKNGPGPNNCGRVSCSYRSAIYWCNEDDFEKEVTWEGIADGALEVLNKCTIGTSFERDVKGRVDYKDKWNVLVRWDNDKC
ncbi:hypothetical protein QBC40DRAFT_297015 [Triangularia verruculosa]|uniref:Uncharacterized protein n=1 Tax=Triangularia verruculosa TaxID=2587418 RepID=A0AAN7ASX5_9PEZI|nr:hypothetical protein QBC40DRAFT_297015 [Triangularia verruculosa]